MPAMEEERTPAAAEPHFLIVTYPAQGHINPARHLARRLLRATGARVTVSTAVSAFRKMFPGAAESDEEEKGHRDGAGIWHVPYSDGYDGGFDRAVHDHTHYMTHIKVEGSRTLACVLDRLRARPARDARRPATVLAAYLHFFRGTDGVDKTIVEAAKSGDPWAEVTVPGLPPLRVRDLPSFITMTSEDDPYAFVVTAFRELVLALDRDDTPTVLANTFDAMEPEAVASLRDHGVDVVPVGPVAVLSHPAVGCFVTHCGWNSTLEAVACGVPVVCAPQWTDQGTNAWLVERLGTGVRAAVSDKLEGGGGVIEADELRRCIDFATSDAVRAKAAVWSEKARAAAAEGGSSEKNLRAFVAQQLPAGGTN
ncbi:hypothetical protein EJB05_31156, partial [Eragrostis curvula]